MRLSTTTHPTACATLHGSHCLHTIIVIVMPSLKRKDDDLVPKHPPEPPAKRSKGNDELPSDLPPLNVVPEWNPLVIENQTERGKPRVPSSVNRSSPIELFKLFFTDKWLDVVVKCTNANAIRIIDEEKNTDYRSPRAWHPVDKYDLMRYFAGVIHMGLHPEVEIADYWGSYEDIGVLHRIREFISLERWQQIDRFLYCEEVRDGMLRTFERVWAFSKHVQKMSCKYWKPGKNLAVDESMQRFTGRAKEITTIPCKRHSTGFKFWILADHGYVLLFMFHAKGDGKLDGPYRLDPQWKEMGFSATEAVVLHLAVSLDPYLLRPNMHIIWLDNLFTKIRLLEALRERGIAAAGTVRAPNNQTPREERIEKAKEKLRVKKEKEAQKKAVKREKEAKKEAAKREKEEKKQAAKKEKEAKSKKKPVKKEKQSSQLPTVVPDSVPLFEPGPVFEPSLLGSVSLSVVASVFDDLFEDPSLESGVLPDAGIVEPDFTPILEPDELPDAEQIEREEIDEGDPETNEPFNEDIARLRSYANKIGWGQTWYAVSNNTVGQMG